MEAVFPISALQKRQKDIKLAAKDEIVRITENGVGAYVFCTEEVFERRLREAAEEAAYEARMAAVIERGHSDIAAGRVYHGVQEAWDEIERRVEAHG